MRSNIKHIPIILVANKSDNDHSSDDALKKFERFGFGPAYPLSAIHGSGVGDILDKVLEYIPTTPMLSDRPPEAEQEHCE